MCGPIACRLSTEADDSQTSPLTCGEPVVSMPYDFLKGISRRSEHKPYPEPEVAMIFKKSELDTAVDLFAIERGLRKAFKEVRGRQSINSPVGRQTDMACLCYTSCYLYPGTHCLHSCGRVRVR